MKYPVRVGLVGIAGYGKLYLDALLDDPRAASTDFVGVADPAADRSPRLSELRERGIPVYSSMDDLLDASELDLVCLATPIHLHAKQVENALNNGISALCEKPVAATINDAQRMARAEAEATMLNPDTFVGIGFQWSFSDAVTALKQDIAAGLLGAPIRLKAIALYPRAESYFHRNDWAGRKYTSSGHAIFDSPLNNATSHFLHAMLYILGKTPVSSAMPVQITSELYCANEIETFDCAAVRVRTDSDAELLFYTAHCIERQFGAAFHYEFERGVIEHVAGGEIVARFNDGRSKTYGNPSVDPMGKIFACVEAARGEGPVKCGIEGAMPHAMCASAAYGPGTAVNSIPASRIRRIDSVCGPLVAVDGLSDSLIDCFAKAVLPAESSRSMLSWARGGNLVRLRSPSAAGRYPAFSRTALSLQTLQS